MTNPFKNNSLAAGLFGYVLGVFTLLGGQAIMGYCNGSNSSTESNPPVFPFYPPVPPVPKDDSFHGLEQDDGGDVIITKSGNSFHRYYECPALNRYRETRMVKSKDAVERGMKPCTKCHP